MGERGTPKVTGVKDMRTDREVNTCIFLRVMRNLNCTGPGELLASLAKHKVGNTEDYEEGKGCRHSGLLIPSVLP